MGYIKRGLVYKHLNSRHQHQQQQKRQIKSWPYLARSLLLKLPQFQNFPDGLIKMMIKNGAMAVAILAALAVASPTPRNVRKRWTEGEDCTSSSVNPEKSGLLFAVDSDGVTLQCDDIDNDANAKK